MAPVRATVARPCYGRRAGGRQGDGVLSVPGFGVDLSVFFRDPDGLEGEVCLNNPEPSPAT